MSAEKNSEIVWIAPTEIAERCPRVIQWRHEIGRREDPEGKKIFKRGRIEHDIYTKAYACVKDVESEMAGLRNRPSEGELGDWLLDYLHSTFPLTEKSRMPGTPDGFDPSIFTEQLCRQMAVELRDIGQNKAYVIPEHLVEYPKSTAVDVKVGAGDGKARLGSKGRAGRAVPDMIIVDRTTGVVRLEEFKPHAQLYDVFDSGMTERLYAPLRESYLLQLMAYIHIARKEDKRVSSLLSELTAAPLPRQKAGDKFYPPNSLKFDTTHYIRSLESRRPVTDAQYGGMWFLFWSAVEDCYMIKTGQLDAKKERSRPPSTTDRSRGLLGKCLAQHCPYRNEQIDGKSCMTVRGAYTYLSRPPGRRW